MAGFHLLRRACSDRLHIAMYTADRWGEIQAERDLTGLYSGFQTIVGGPSWQTFREVPPDFRAIFGKHAAFYRLAPEGEILIVRVLHACMLPELHLRDVDEAWIRRPRGHLPPTVATRAE